MVKGFLGALRWLLREKKKFIVSHLGSSKVK